MTREEYIDFANALKNNYTIDFDKLPEFCDMAISTLSENKIAKIENTTVDELKNILDWGHCFCGDENTPAYKAINNAIATISSLETLKAEIKNNTDHCECVPDGACISVEKVIGLIDSHLKLSESTEPKADNKSEWIPVSERLPEPYKGE